MADRSPGDAPARPDEAADVAAITRVVDDWGILRDTGRWDRLRALYTADATMHTTWFAGSAAAFVERSAAMAGQGARSMHVIAGASVEVTGDRAVAETRMILLLRASLDEAAVDVTCYGRFYDLFLRTQIGWRIRKRVPIYDKDRLDAVEPGRALRLDEGRLAGFAEGYRHLAYVQAMGGATLTPGLPTAGSPEEAALRDEGRAWLSAS